MVAVRDRYIHAIAQGQPVPAVPDDSQTGELFVPPSLFGSQPTKEPEKLEYPTPEESIASMKVPEGFEVQLVGSEREFPALANINQLNIDNRGRIWVSCMASYPQWKPGDPKPGDRLVILSEADPKTGRAAKATVFYDQLACPTGFEFWNGGVLVVDQPRLLFLKDTDGDDKADLVEEFSDGWASDDTHHTIGAFEWSPGGLLHMLEGVSMTTAVETPWGPFRQAGKPGCYVLDPRSRKLRHFVTPGYGNPWCYVFDGWGQGIVGDGTTPQQHWDTPLSGAPIAGRKGLTAAFDGSGMRPNVGSEWIRTRQFPDEWQNAFVFACVINMNGLTTFNAQEDGAGFKGGRRLIGGDKKRPDDLLKAEKNMTFRPVDPQIGADGALYFGDWCAALIGHMQYSQRDPNRDHRHGRVFRLVNKNKPLLTPVLQAGQPVPVLLEQLTAYEPRTRYRARRELRDRPTAEVLAAIQTALAALPPSSPQAGRLLLECLWVQQGHHAVDPALLARVLRAPTPHARAAATRVLADEWERIPNAMALMRVQVTDEFPRTRCEALRALSFVPALESVEAALSVVNLPMDYWIDYTLNATLTALEPVWKPALLANSVAAGNPAGLAILQKMAGAIQPAEAAVAGLKTWLTQPELPAAERARIMDTLVAARGSADNGKAIYRRICIACHQWGGEGLAYGPALSGVAKRLGRKDLIESILEPNAKIDPAYATTLLELQDGSTVAGFVSSETDAEVVIKAAGGVEQKVAKANIKKRDTQKVSSMPEGLANAMSPAEFLDLIEFLAAQK